ncbi:hypothetical protein [Nannocystis punicea]|uniref:Tetratricopeptide repeat protein n=1 Tax=Nannocystis punicea TaxID=2995304 RepID=A0ABY7HA64_9BACT|nr:hypothetical protein [Nannocystis poenicansa]WAS96162.1 hypothetical protein O0S08_08365 [Nannocystis poenicansa]
MLLQVPKDMLFMKREEMGRKLGRAAVAMLCATTLATPSVARATEPEGPEEPSTAETSEELNSQAQKHASKAIEHFNNGAFVDSEEEFRRVAFFAPKWRPLHFNLAVLAEAQGKLGTAVSEYKEFRPHGSPDEQLIVDQRLDELGRRKMKISGAYKRQIALSATTMTLGFAGLGGAATAFVFYFKQKNEYEDAMKYNDSLQVGQEALMRDEKAPKAGLLYAGVYVGLIALALVGYSIIPLRNAIKSKKQLDGINLGKTRLRWNGGAGATLSF